MISEPQQTAYDTFGRLILTRMLADMAPSAETHSPLPAYFTALYQDMLDNPGAYGIPHEPYGGFLARQTMTPEEMARHEVLKAARMRARKAIFATLEFLFELGKAGAPEGDNLTLPRAEFERLAAAAVKKGKLRQLLPALERCGLVFSSGDPLVVSNSRFAGLPAALAQFSRACAPVKDFDFYLFRRVDLAVLAGKTAPTFEDALRTAPQPFQENVAATDSHLARLRYKREIFVDGGDMTYRVRYSKKADTVVYWLRIQETFNLDLGHYLRWKMSPERDARLFALLEQASPGLARRVFDGLKTCQECYGTACMARAEVALGDASKPVCNEAGWNRIGFSRAAYADLWAVLTAACEL